MEKFYIQQIRIDELAESKKGVRQLCGCILMISRGPRDSLSSVSPHLESELTTDALVGILTQLSITEHKILELFRKQNNNY